VYVYTSSRDRMTCVSFFFLTSLRSENQQRRGYLLCCHEIYPYGGWAGVEVSPPSPVTRRSALGTGEIAFGLPACSHAARVGYIALFCSFVHRVFFGWP